MNRIVKEHYPVEKLPEDLREGLPRSGLARVSVEVEGSLSEPTGKASPATTMAGIRADIEKLAREGRLPPISEDPVARIRKLRDDWDD